MLLQVHCKPLKPYLPAHPVDVEAKDNLLARGKLGQSSLRTTAVGGGRDLGAAAAALVDALVLLAHLLGGAARAGDGGNITVVRVDADEVGGQAEGPDVLDDDVAGAAVVATVAAGPVQLARVDDGVVLDGDGAAAVVLDDLVVGVLGAAALDEDVAIAEGRDGVCG